MRQPRGRVSFANAMSVIALFVALGGTGLAASQLGKNSVGARQLKRSAVTTAKIRKEAVTATKVKKGTLTGGQIDASTLGVVPSAQQATTAQHAATAQQAASLESPEDWHEVGAPGEPAFQNGWGNVESPGNEKVGFFKDREGIVHLKGVAGGGSGVIFQLPPGYRPGNEKALLFAVACNGCGTGITTIKAVVFGPKEEPSEDGGVLAGAPTVWLEGISFRAAS